MLKTKANRLIVPVGSSRLNRWRTSIHCCRWSGGPRFRKEASRVMLETSKFCLSVICFERADFVSPLIMCYVLFLFMAEFFDWQA